MFTALGHVRPAAPPGSEDPHGDRPEFPEPLPARD